MKNPYQKLTDHIQPPDGLNERVLAAAREEPAAERPHRPVNRRFRRVACAACALAWVICTFCLESYSALEENSMPVMALSVFSFGLTAYAADTEENLAPNANGGLAFSFGGEMDWSEDEGYYTGCMFQVTGEGITRVALSVDRGELYRWEDREHLTEEEIRQIQQVQEDGEVGPNLTQAEDGTWSVQETTRLGASAAEDYDPDVRYGFWVPGVETADWEADPRAASRESIDTLDGAHLTVTVTFADNSTQSKTYTLSTGRLRYVEDSGNPRGTLLPALAGDNEAYIYGVYAESETEGRYFLWPVQGANTVRTSNSFGGRWQPGGQSQVFHYGIDIPAEKGTPILAAADGIVTEIGFDTQRGNYIVLDHGGGLETLYGQCRDILDTLAEGDTVSAGEMIAAVGSSGMSTGPHLHFEVLQDGEPQNPVAYFDSAVRDTLWVA